MRPEVAWLLAVPSAASTSQVVGAGRAAAGTVGAVSAVFHDADTYEADTVASAAGARVGALAGDVHVAAGGTVGADANNDAAAILSTAVRNCSDAI